VLAVAADAESASAISAVVTVEPAIIRRRNRGIFSPFFGKFARDVGAKSGA
jgi:hypothetical protein